MKYRYIFYEKNQSFQGSDLEYRRKPKEISPVGADPFICPFVRPFRRK